MKRAGKVKYRKLGQTVTLQTEKEDSEDEQFEESDVPVKPSWRSIVLAVFLFVAGGGLLVWGSLLFAGVIGEDFGKRATPMLILGAICFVPGFYNVRIAYHAWRGDQGYSFSDIPS